MTIATLNTVVRADHILGPSQGRWSYESYSALPDDGAHYEIIDGVLYMAPAPIPEHEQIVALLCARLVTAVYDTQLGSVMTSPDIDLGDLVVRPDVVVVLNQNLAIIDQKRIIGAPDLVIEVTSPGTAAYDRSITEGKQGAYARAGIPEYWIADPATRTIEVLTLEDGAYTSLGMYAGSTSIPSHVLPELSFTVQSCFPRT